MRQGKTRGRLALRLVAGVVVFVVGTTYQMGCMLGALFVWHTFFDQTPHYVPVVTGAYVYENDAEKRAAANGERIFKDAPPESAGRLGSSVKWSFCYIDVTVMEEVVVDNCLRLLADELDTRPETGVLQSLRHWSDLTLRELENSSCRSDLTSLDIGQLAGCVEAVRAQQVRLAGAI